MFNIVTGVLFLVLAIVQWYLTTTELGHLQGWVYLIMSHFCLIHLKLNMIGDKL
jgi:hypothetical protein